MNSIWATRLTVISEVTERDVYKPANGPGNRYSIEVAILVPIIIQGHDFYLYRDKIKVKLDIIDNLQGATTSPWRFISLPSKDGQSFNPDLETLRLILVAHCERCAARPIFQPPCSSNGYARQCFPAEMFLFPDEETITATPLIALRANHTTDATLTILLPERPRRPKETDGSSRCLEESLALTFLLVDSSGATVAQCTVDRPLRARKHRETKGVNRNRRHNPHPPPASPSRITGTPEAVTSGHVTLDINPKFGSSVGGQRIWIVVHNLQRSTNQDYFLNFGACNVCAQFISSPGDSMQLLECLTPASIPGTVYPSLRLRAEPDSPLVFSATPFCFMG